METLPDSPRTLISRRPVFIERERSEICFSYRECAEGLLV